MNKDILQQNETQMTDAEIWAQTYGIEDIPDEHCPGFKEHMFLRAHVRAFGRDRYYRGDVREFFALIGQECPPPGRDKKGLWDQIALKISFGIGSIDRTPHSPF